MTKRDTFDNNRLNGQIWLKSQKQKQIVPKWLKIFVWNILQGGRLWFNLNWKPCGCQTEKPTKLLSHFVTVTLLCESAKTFAAAPKLASSWFNNKTYSIHRFSQKWTKTGSNWAKMIENFILFTISEFIGAFVIAGTKVRP